jgi:hypothetical protein
MAHILIVNVNDILSQAGLLSMLMHKYMLEKYTVKMKTIYFSATSSSPLLLTGF